MSSTLSDLQRHLRLEAKLEARATKQEAALQRFNRECVYLRTHVNLIEARLEQYQNLKPEQGRAQVFNEALDASCSDQARSTETRLGLLERVANLEEKEKFNAEQVSALDARLLSLEKSGLRQSHDQIFDRDASPDTSKDIAMLDGQPASSTAQSAISYPEVESVEFEETVWDAALFIGDRQVGLLGSVAILVMFVLNVFMQSMFIFIVLKYMSDFPFTSDVITDIVRWRFDVGHNLDQVSIVEEQSLISRVCARDATLNVANRFADKLETIVSYLPRDSEVTLFGLEIGPIMCLMASMVWMLTCAKEFQRITQLLRLLVVVPKTKGMRSSFIPKDDSLTLHELSIPRTVVFCVVIGIRTAAGGVLLYAGMKYLCATFSLAELFLNAVALELILSIDEVIFEGLAPINLHSFLKNIEPTPLAVHSYMGVEIKFPLFLTVTMALLVTSYVSFIQPNTNGLNDAWEALCSGDVDFAYGIPKAVPYMAWSQTRRPSTIQEYFPPGKSLEQFQPSSFRHQVVKDIVMNGETGTLVLPSTISTFKPALSNVEGSLVNEVELSVESAYELANLQCEEVGRNLTEWELDSIKDTLRNHSIGPACHKGGPWETACWQDTLFGYIARTYCPRLCECDKANSGQALRDKGCPSKCFDRGNAKDAVEHRKCADLNFSRINGFFPEIEWQAEAEREKWSVQVDHKSHWFDLCNRFEAASRRLPESMQRTASEISADLRSDGCAAVRKWMSLGTDLCEPMSMFPGAPTFRYYCPVACRCPETGRRYWDYCPAHCKHGEDPTLDSLQQVPLCSHRDGSSASSEYPCACGSSVYAKTRCSSKDVYCEVEPGKTEGRCLMPLCTEKHGILASSVYPCKCGKERTAKTTCKNSDFFCRAWSWQDEGTCIRYKSEGCRPYCPGQSSPWTSKCSWKECRGCPDCKACSVGPLAACKTCVWPESKRQALDHCATCNDGYAKEGTTCRALPTTSMAVGLTVVANPSNDQFGSLEEARYHKVVVGNPKGNPNTPGKCLPDTDTTYSGKNLSTSCCKDGQKKGSRKGCKQGQTYQEAVGHCNRLGMRLCTAAEFAARKSQGTGCGFDQYLNWASDACVQGLAYTIELFKEELAISTGVNLNGIVIESVSYEVHFILSFSTCVSLDMTRQSLARVYQVPVRDVFVEFTAHHSADSAGVGVSVVVQASSEKAVGELVQTAFDSSALSEQFARACVNATPTVEETPKAFLVAQASVMSNSFAHVQTPNDAALERIGKNLDGNVSIVVPVCTDRGGVKASDHYPCTCGSSSKAKTRCAGSGWRCRVYGGDDEGLCIAIPDWYLADKGDTCRSDCEKRGLACDGDEQDKRNGEVASTNKIKTLIARLGSETYDDECDDIKGDFSPQFAQSQCRFPKQVRDRSRDCDQKPVGKAWHRLCYCSKPTNGSSF